jgi:hypothetical protein
MSRPYYYIRKTSEAKLLKKISWKWWIAIIIVIGAIWYISSEEISYDPQVIELDVEDESNEE